MLSLTIFMIALTNKFMEQQHGMRKILDLFHSRGQSSDLYLEMEFGLLTLVNFEV